MWSRFSFSSLHPGTTLALAFVSCFMVGALAWSGNIYMLPIVLLLPLALRWAMTPGQTIAIVTGYHAGATWPMLPGARLFFGNSLDFFGTFLLWLAIIAVLSLPWALLCARRRWRLLFGVPAALVVVSFLPTGIANPISAAGILFPGTAWLGLTLMIGVFAILPIRPVHGLIAAAVLSLVCHLMHPSAPISPADWQGINTTFGGQGFGAGVPNPLAQYDSAVEVQRLALESKAKVIVFPEGTVYHWNASTDAYWSQTIQQLRREGKTVLVGASVTIPSWRERYRNVLIIRGAQNGLYQQHIPLPVSMWQPITGDGVPLRYAGRSVVTINHRRVAPIICYEELLVEPVLLAMLQQPDLLVGVSNEYWSHGTYIPAIQSEALSAWSRLFWIPIITAVNE
jgi:hypothetical protein